MSRAHEANSSCKKDNGCGSAKPIDTVDDVHLVVDNGGADHVMVTGCTYVASVDGIATNNAEAPW